MQDTFEERTYTQHTFEQVRAGENIILEDLLVLENQLKVEHRESYCKSMETELSESRTKNERALVRGYSAAYVQRFRSEAELQTSRTQLSFEKSSSGLLALLSHLRAQFSGVKEGNDFKEKELKKKMAYTEKKIAETVSVYDVEFDDNALHLEREHLMQKAAELQFTEYDLRVKN